MYSVKGFDPVHYSQIQHEGQCYKDKNPMTILGNCVSNATMKPIVRFLLIPTEKEVRVNDVRSACRLLANLKDFLLKRIKVLGLVRTLHNYIIPECNNG